MERHWRLVREIEDLLKGGKRRQPGERWTTPKGVEMYKPEGGGKPRPVPKGRKKAASTPKKSRGSGKASASFEPPAWHLHQREDGRWSSLVDGTASGLHRTKEEGIAWVRRGMRDPNAPVYEWHGDHGYRLLTESEPEPAPEPRRRAKRKG